MTDLSLPESAFVNAVVKSMSTQDEVLAKQAQLKEELEGASRAHELALREAGIDEMTPVEEYLAYQERLLNAAIERSGRAANDPVVRGLKSQSASIARLIRAQAAEEEQTLGRIDGPAL